MEATYFSETSVDFRLTTRRYIPEVLVGERLRGLGLEIMI
jgi:hypothetical protein